MSWTEFGCRSELQQELETFNHHYPVLRGGCAAVWAGSNARVTAEINKLKAMARRGRHRTELTALMEVITDNATVAVTMKPEKPMNKVRQTL